MNFNVLLSKYIVHPLVKIKKKTLILVRLISINESVFLWNSCDGIDATREEIEV